MIGLLGAFDKGVVLAVYSTANRRDANGPATFVVNRLARHIRNALPGFLNESE